MYSYVFHKFDIYLCKCIKSSMRCYAAHSPKAHPEIPKKSEAMEEKVPLRREPEKAPLRREPEKAIRQVPMVPKMVRLEHFIIGNCSK